MAEIRKQVKRLKGSRVEGITISRQKAKGKMQNFNFCNLQSEICNAPKAQGFDNVQRSVIMGIE